jgi:mRNA interferase RelE/StbE
LEYKINLAPTALKMLKAISDRRVRRKLVERIDQLKEEPEKQGKPLLGELAGYRSVRAIGQRYRVIYGVDEGNITVIVVAVGIRKAGSKDNIYDLARKLLKLGLVEPKKPPRKK